MKQRTLPIPPVLLAGDDILKMVALAAQVRAGTQPVPVESILDEMVRIGLRNALPPSCWRGLKAADIGKAIDALIGVGFLQRCRGSSLKWTGPALSVVEVVAAIRAPAAAPTSTISVDTMRSTLQRLADIVHPEIAEVLDAVRAQYLGEPS